MLTPPRHTSDRGTPLDRALAASAPGFATDSFFSILLLLGLSLGLQSIVFAPYAIWPAAYVCLVPWVVVIGACSNPHRVYYTSYLLGLAFFLCNVRWIAPITVEGYIALSAYLAVYFPLVACPIRHAVRRRRIPMTLALPVIWVGSEFLRGIVISGFPWFFLAHSHYRVLSLIQVSDLFGAYGVSFVIALINGAIAEAIFATGRRMQAGPGPRPRRLAWPHLLATAVLVIAAFVYGQVQMRRPTGAPGLRIAVIQGDYPIRTSDTFNNPADRQRAYFRLMQEAAAEHPDVYLLPETPWTMFLNESFLRESNRDDPWWRWSGDCFRVLQAFSTQQNAYVITGAVSRELTPYDRLSESWTYNSAFVFRPDGSTPFRYDKVHTVYFGETVPFRFGRFRFLYIWFNNLSPFGGDVEYSINRGSEFKVFEIQVPPESGRSYRFGIPICYEDVIPYVSRRFVIGPDGRKRVDFLLNISNDGWFLHSNELPQHLASCVFRAVENRVGIARAVNTGISGFIDADGRIHHLVTNVLGRSHGPGITGYQVAPVEIDSRTSLYSRIGDVFALTCCVLWGLAYLDYLIVRIRVNRARSARNREGAANACET